KPSFASISTALHRFTEGSASRWALSTLVRIQIHQNLRFDMLERRWISAALPPREASAIRVPGCGNPRSRHPVLQFPAKEKGSFQRIHDLHRVDSGCEHQR